MKFLLTDFELNGINDSDFVCSYYDTETHSLGFHEYGTTRCAAPTMIGWSNEKGQKVSSVVIAGEPTYYPTIEILEQARVALQDKLFAAMKAADIRKRDEPQPSDLYQGLKLFLTHNCRMQKVNTEKCRKCDGSGKWINPRNDQDSRECFACRGTGQHYAGKSKNAQGKQEYVFLTAGLTGSAVDWTSFGTFYRNGYNHPDRHNTTVQLIGEDGNKWRAGLKNLRLDRDYQTDTELRVKADCQSRTYQFSYGYPHFAWDTNNFALEVLKF
jgi:hypothetical protein